MNSNNIDNWINHKGQKLLREIGLKEGQTVLEFGCGQGNYTLPSSLILGEKGIIYSFDKNKNVLNDLKQKIRKKALKNIKLINSEDTLNSSLSDNSVDTVLLYDIIHLLKNRKKLLKEIYKVTKPNGILSVYPKHHESHMNMSKNEIIKEIESIGFKFEKTLLKTLMHDSKIEKGYILNFRRK